MWPFHFSHYFCKMPFIKSIFKTPEVSEWQPNEGMGACEGKQKRITRYHVFVRKARTPEHAMEGSARKPEMDAAWAGGEKWNAVGKNGMSCLPVWFFCSTSREVSFWIAARHRAVGEMWRRYNEGRTNNSGLRRGVLVMTESWESGFLYLYPLLSLIWLGVKSIYLAR